MNYEETKNGTEEFRPEYNKIVNKIYSNEDWENADDMMREEYAKMVVRELIRKYNDEELDKIEKYLYFMGHKREYYILRVR